MIRNAFCGQTIANVIFPLNFMGIEQGSDSMNMSVSICKWMLICQQRTYIFFFYLTNFHSTFSFCFSPDFPFARIMIVIQMDIGCFPKKETKCLPCHFYHISFFSKFIILIKTPFKQWFRKPLWVEAKCKPRKYTHNI